MSFLTSLIPSILDLLTPALKEVIESSIKAWWEKAKLTENAWDNYAVMLVAAVLNINLEGS